MSRAIAQLKQQAKAAEERGDVDEAARLYLQAQDVESASRVYMNVGQFAKAGRIMFRAIGLPLERMGHADLEQRKLAVRAAICLAKGGETHNAAALFAAAGDQRRAVETLEKAGDTVAAARMRAQIDGSGDMRVAQVSGQVAAAKFANALKHEQAGELASALTAYVQSKAFSDAGRVARKMGKIADAGQLFEEAAMYYEAAVCWNDLKDLRRCFDALTRVPRDHPRYRGCALKVIELGSQFGEVSFEMDQFVSKFVSSGPENAQEIEALAALGKLYENAGFQENARECYRKIIAVAPQHRAALLLSELENGARASAMVYEKIVREDGAFHGDVPRRGPAPLPDVPDLPDLPPLPGGAAPPARPVMPTPAMARTEYGAPGGHPQQQSYVAPAVPGHAPTMAALGGAHAQTMPRVATGQPVTPQTMVQPRQPSSAPGADLTGEHRKQTGPVAREEQGVVELVPGALIADRYRLEQQIGQGGTAVVFKATDLELEEEVAVKVFTIVVDDPDMVRRFKQELSVTRQLSHPNIVRLHDIGTHRGFRFLTMEILQGTDLASVLQKGMLPLLKSLDYLVQACSGLQLAHERGIVHRDIKPENFFVTTQSVLKVMDFGIAKKAQSQKLTQAGFIAGTPPYMSPEQISGFATVTHLADIYSLGIVAYEMFTGSLPFMHEEMMPLLLMHMNEPPKPPIEQNRKIPKPLNDLILRTLEKKPERRVQSMKEFAEDLTRMRPVVAKASG